MKNIFLLLTLFVTVSNCFSQGEIDSLRGLLKLQKEDSDKIKTSLQLSGLFESANSDSSLYYAKYAYKVADNANYVLKCAALQTLAGIYENRGRSDYALGYYLQIVKLATQYQLPDETVNAYLAIAGLFQSLDKRQEEFEYYELAISEARKSGDKSLVEKALNRGSDFYFNIGNYGKALELLNEWARMDSAYKNSAEYLSGIGDIYRNEKDYKQAVRYYLSALNLLENKNDSLDLGILYNNFSLIYNDQKNYPAAIEYLLKSKAIFAALKNEARVSFENYELASTYLRAGQYSSALHFADDAIAYNKSKNNLNKLAFLYKLKANAQFNLKQFSEAYTSLARSNTYTDSTSNHEIQNKLTALQTSILQEKKDKEISVLNQKKKTQSIIEVSLLSGLGLLLIVAGIIYYQRNQIKRERDRAEQSEKFKEQFLANMSHEIRTPMNAVLGMTNLLIDTPLNEKQKKYLSAVKKSSENLLVILNDILDLSKLESGKMELERLPFRLQEQVNHAMDIMRFKADEKGLLFTSEIADDVPPVVLGDAARLNQILINLLSNAIKFTAKGQVKLSISTAGESKIKFSIADTGIGMTAVQQAKIFESFTQAESNTSRKYGGTGLGLAISKTLVELQGGNLEVKSEPGRGSEFTFTIAYATGDEKDIPTGYGTAGIDYSALSKLNILIAEDYEFNQVVIKDTLEQLVPGITIDIAINGKIAVEKVQKGDYDMVLMDVHMPEMDGYEATRYIRNNLKMDIPIIALTASVIKSDLDKCIAAGMNGYVTKPFTHKELLRGLIKYIKP